MKVELAAGIESMSGSVKGVNGSRLVFKTLRNPNGKKEVRAYLMPRGTYKRKSKPSDSELDARELFAKRQTYACQLMHERGLSKQEAWKIARKEITTV